LQSRFGARFAFEADTFDPTAAFVSIGQAYNGTNSGVGSGGIFVFDGTHLSYDSNVSTPGYTVVAEVQGDPIQAADITNV
jgi:hypothetical protein